MRFIDKHCNILTQNRVYWKNYAPGALRMGPTLSARLYSVESEEIVQIYSSPQKSKYRIRATPNAKWLKTAKQFEKSNYKAQQNVIKFLDQTITFPINLHHFWTRWTQLEFYSKFFLKLYWAQNILRYFTLASLVKVLRPISRF